MSSHAPGEGRYSPGCGRRPQPHHDDPNGRMYDDEPDPGSRSRSRSRIHESAGELSRTPPRGPAADRRFNNNDDGGPSGPRDPRHDRRDRGRGGPRRGSASPRRGRGRSGYRDRDREGYRSPRYGSRSRSRSRSYESRSRSRSRSPRGRRPPPESREVMMDGLPVDMKEDDISHELTEYYHVEGLEEVRVIRDRQTKVSRQLGFLRFRNLDFSRDFVERNLPAIYLYGPTADDRGTKVRIAFSREREDRKGEWTCTNCSVVNYPGRQKCFRCHALPSIDITIQPPQANALRPANNGDNDVSTDGTPSQFLLFRGLEPSVNEEILAKGVSKLYRPAPGSQNQDANSGPKKGAKVASTTGDSNLGARDGSIRRVLLVRDRRSNESWRFGFAELATVGDAQAALTRYNSFETFTISSKPVMASYIHAGVFVPILNPTPSTQRFTFSPLGNPTMKLAYWDEEAYVTVLSTSTAELDGPKERAGNGAAEKQQSKASKDGGTEKSKKRKPDTANSTGTKKLAMSSHLQFWSDRHAELHGIKRKQGEDEAATTENDGAPKKKAQEPTTTPGSSESPVPSQSYADPDRHCCYLCMRQFKTGAEVNKHERLSQLHRDNLQNGELKSKALAKLEKKRENSQAGAEYRDRAKERRQTFGSTKNKTKDKDKSSKPQPPVEAEDEATATPTMSKGASLLGKMGWSAGSGLGAQGTGITAPVATDLYVQGVGLGAQGGKVGDAVEEAGRNTRGRYDEFLEKTKDNARERYERLNRDG